LTKKADSETDPKTRIALYQDLMKLLLDEGPFVMLLQGKFQVVLRPNIQGYQYFPVGYARLLPVSKN